MWQGYMERNPRVERAPSPAAFDSALPLTPTLTLASETFASNLW
jgi:hypothetical protein